MGETGAGESDRAEKEKAHMRLYWKTVAAAGLAAGLAGLPAPHALAQKVDFAGKRIEMVVPFAPGGGSDVYIRAIGRRERMARMMGR